MISPYWKVNKLKKCYVLRCEAEIRYRDTVCTALVSRYALFRRWERLAIGETKFTRGLVHHTLCIAI